MDVDGYVGGFFVVHAVLEGVLHQRNEQQRCDGCLRGFVGQRHEDPHVARLADAHQLDVVAQEPDLGRQRDGRPAAVVEYVAQHAAQIVDGLLGAFGVEQDERVDVVQRVEQEMGVQLAFEVLQLGLCAAVFELLAGCFGAVPAAGHADGDTYAHDQQVEHQVAGEEPHRVLPGAFDRRAVHVGQQEMAEQQVDEEHHRADEQQVVAGEPAEPPRREVAVDQQEIVRVEDHHEGERNQQEPGILRSGHQRTVRPGYEERHAEDHGPDRDMDQPARIFRLRSSHNAKI